MHNIFVVYYEISDELSSLKTWHVTKTSKIKTNCSAFYTITLCKKVFDFWICKRKSEENQLTISNTFFNSADNKY